MTLMSLVSQKINLIFWFNYFYHTMAQSDSKNVNINGYNILFIAESCTDTNQVPCLFSSCKNIKYNRNIILKFSESAPIQTKFIQSQYGSCAVHWKEICIYIKTLLELMLPIDYDYIAPGSIECNRLIKHK